MKVSNKVFLIGALLFLIYFIAFFCFAPKAHSMEAIKQDPIYEAESFEETQRYLSLDLRGAYELETENYVYFNNHRNRHCLVIKKNSNIVFIGTNVCRAYMIVALQDNEKGTETWLVFQVETLNKGSVVTQMFFEMKKEFIDFVIDSCPRPSLKEGVKL